MLKLLSILMLLLMPWLAQAADVKFVSTLDGKPLSIPADVVDSSAAKDFMASGKNSYIGNADAIKAGKKHSSSIVAQPVTVRMPRVQ